MSNETVYVSRDDGKKLQWGLNTLYRKEGKKSRFDSKKAKIVFFSLFGIFVLGTVFISSNPERYDEDSSLSSIFEKDGKQKLTVPLYDSSKSQPVNFVSKGTGKSIPPTKLEIFSSKAINDIPSGAEADAKLLTGATDGMVKAILTDDLEYGGHVYLPEGTVLIGAGTSNDDRLKISFHTAVFEDGSGFEISASAYDSNTRLLGLKGSVLTRRALKLAVSAGLNVIVGATQALEEVDVNQGVIVKRSNLKNAALKGIGNAAVEQSKEFMANLKDSQSHIFVEAGQKLTVVFQGKGL